MDYKISLSLILPLLSQLLPAAAQEPTQPGISPACDAFHLVVTGDQCGTIEAQYGITDEEFKEWNPAIDASCSNLWLDYYICVGVSDDATSTTTTTSTSTSTTSGPEPTATPPEPLIPGIVESCQTFYQVQPGDSCYSITMAAGITTAQFREWNTGINAGCTNLWLDYYVCIGV
ncbi:LysM peptidoglycan-binding domain-containing protein [Aspergillus undulatus]|uniref:LysM peptidoglycan-binding domain-containing protein n=1 Tax=Aspergillus undulatus TaxID=1810928 RepID=UPI003CCDEECA